MDEQLAAQVDNTENTPEGLADAADVVAEHLREAGQHQLLHRMREDVIRLAHLEPGSLRTRLVTWIKEKWKDELAAL